MMIQYAVKGRLHLESESRTYIHVYVCWQESHAGILLYCATATTCIMLTYIGQHHNDNPIKTQ